MAFVQQLAAGNDSAGASGTRVIPLTASMTAGNAMILAMRVPSGRHTTTVVDSQSNTWSLDVATAGANDNVAIASCVPTTPLTTSDTVSFTYLATGAVICGWALLEFSNLAAVATDSANGATATAVSSQSITLAAATTGASDLVVSVFSSGLDQGAGGITPPSSPWVEVNPAGVTKTFLDIAYQDQVTVGSTPTATWTETISTNISAAIAAYVETVPVTKAVSIPRNRAALRRASTW